MKNIEEIKLLTFYCDTLMEEISILDYMKRLLITLFKELEGFSGKRPFGNSGWEYDIAICLIKNKVINGKLDEDGYVEDINDKQFQEVLLEIIKSIN